MHLAVRFLLWLTCAAASLAVDVLTKAAPHPVVVNHYSHTPALILVLVSCFLCALGLWHSNILAIGSGLMFGGLCGNGGQLIMYGYASDWIPIGGWLTNIADISGATGLLCCFTGYILARRGAKGPVASSMRRVRKEESGYRESDL